MENNQERKNKRNFGIGRLMATAGVWLLAGYWMFKTFAKKDHTHEFMSAGKGGTNVLYITDENTGDYITYAKERRVYDGSINEQLSYDYYGARLTIDDSVTAVVFLTTDTLEISELVPVGGGYDDMRVVIAGNVQLRLPDSGRGEYCFSGHIYADQSNNNGGKSYFVGNERNGCEVALFRKNWYFLV